MVADSIGSTHWITIPGLVIKGHQVASGKTQNSPYTDGTIKLQAPFFKERGLDLSTFHYATLNVSIHPFSFRMESPEYTFHNVEWTDRHPPESFSFSHCRIGFAGVTYDGWIYYPHPETKKRHFQDSSILEIILPLIPDITYGVSLSVTINANAVDIT